MSTKCIIACGKRLTGKVVFPVGSTVCCCGTQRRSLWSCYVAFQSHSRLFFRALQSYSGLKNSSAAPQIYPKIRDGELDSEFLVGTLMQWLNCSVAQASSILKECPNLKHCHLTSVHDCIKYLQENGISTRLIIENPWLLNYSLSTLRQRMDALAQVRLAPATIPLLKLTQKQLHRIAKRWISDEQNQKWAGFESRLEYLAHYLKCEARDLAFQMDKYANLLTLDFNNVSTTLHLLLQHGIKPADILNHLNIFHHRSHRIESRLNAAREANVANIKIWMLLCTKQVFLATTGKLQDTGEYFQDKDAVMYLAERLECSQEYVHCLAKRYPKLLNVRLTKLKEILDFLFANGFTPNQVCLAPHVFQNRVYTLESRLDDFRQLGYKPVHLHSLWASAQAHKKLLKQLQHEKKSSCDSSPG